MKTNHYRVSGITIGGIVTLNGVRYAIHNRNRLINGEIGTFGFETNSNKKRKLKEYYED